MDKIEGYKDRSQEVVRPTKTMAERTMLAYHLICDLLIDLLERMEQIDQAVSVLPQPDKAEVVEELFYQDAKQKAKEKLVMDMELAKKIPRLVPFMSPEDAEYLESEHKKSLHLEVNQDNL